MSDTERDELAHLIDPNALELDAYPWPRDAADRVLGSRWLREHDAEVAAKALESHANTFRGESYTGVEVQNRGRARAAEYRAKYAPNCYQNNGTPHADLDREQAK